METFIFKQCQADAKLVRLDLLLSAAPIESHVGALVVSHQVP